MRIDANERGLINKTAGSGWVSKTIGGGFRNRSQLANVGCFPVSSAFFCVAPLCLCSRMAFFSRSWWVFYYVPICVPSPAWITDYIILVESRTSSRFDFFTYLSKVKRSPQPLCPSSVMISLTVFTKLGVCDVMRARCLLISWWEQMVKPFRIVGAGKIVLWGKVCAWCVWHVVFGTRVLYRRGLLQQFVVKFRFTPVRFTVSMVFIYIYIYWW